MVQLGWLLRFSQCWNHSVHLDCIRIEAWSPHPTLWLLAKFHSLWLLGWGLIFLSVSKGAGIALKAYRCSFSGGLSWTLSQCLYLEATRRSPLTWKLSKLWIFSPKKKAQFEVLLFFVKEVLCLFVCLFACLFSSNWRIIALQCCVGFSDKIMWISHGGLVSKLSPTPATQ